MNSSSVGSLSISDLIVLCKGFELFIVKCSKWDRSSAPPLDVVGFGLTPVRSTNLPAGATAPPKALMASISPSYKCFV